MEKSKLKAIIEGLLFACGDEGITIKQLSRITNKAESDVKETLESLEETYNEPDRGMTIMQSNQVFHLTTKPNHSEYFKKLLELPPPTRMSQAALETLAIIAYQQPITRVEIEEIRGVRSDHPVRTLIARSLVEKVGRKESVGRPMLFGTSKDFLTYFGLTSLEELPPLPEKVSAEEVEQEASLFFERLNEMDESGK